MWGKMGFTVLWYGKNGLLDNTKFDDERTAKSPAIDTFAARSTAGPNLLPSFAPARQPTQRGRAARVRPQVKRPGTFSAPAGRVRGQAGAETAQRLPCFPSLGYWTLENRFKRGGWLTASPDSRQHDCCAADLRAAPTQSQAVAGRRDPGAKPLSQGRPCGDLVPLMKRPALPPAGFPF